LIDSIFFTFDIVLIDSEIFEFEEDQKLEPNGTSSTTHSIINTSTATAVAVVEQEEKENNTSREPTKENNEKTKKVEMELEEVEQQQQQQQQKEEEEEEEEEESPVMRVVESIGLLGTSLPVKIPNRMLATFNEISPSTNGNNSIAPIDSNPLESVLSEEKESLSKGSRDSELPYYSLRQRYDKQTSSYLEDDLLSKSFDVPASNNRGFKPIF